MIKPVILTLVVCLVWTWPTGEVCAQGKSKKVKKTKKARRSPRKGRVNKGKSTTRPRKKSRRSRRRRRRKDRWPAMHLEHMHTREQLRVRLYDRRGRAVRSTPRKMRRFLRCHRSGRKRSMSWRLIRNLYRVSRLYKGKKILIYSAFRHRSRAALKTSRHIRGMAADIAVQGVSPHELRDKLRATFKKAGVGYYPHLPFVHFDVRKRAGFWVDVSGSGEGSRYVGSSHQYIKDEKKYGVGSIYLAPLGGVLWAKPTDARMVAGVAARLTVSTTATLQAEGIKMELLDPVRPLPARAPVQGPPPVGTDVAPVLPPASKKAPNGRKAPTKRGARGSNRRSNP